MKNVFKSMLTCAALIAALGLTPAVAPAAMCDQCDGPGQGGKGAVTHHLKMMAKQLGLSAEQKQQVKGILEKSRPQVEPLMKRMAEERKALHTLVHSEQFDESAIRAQAGKLATVQGDLAVEHARISQEVRKLLTPEQQRTFAEMKPGYGGKRGQMGCGCGNCDKPHKKRGK